MVIPLVPVKWEEMLRMDKECIPWMTQRQLKTNHLSSHPKANPDPNVLLSIGWIVIDFVPSPVPSPMSKEVPKPLKFDIPRANSAGIGERAIVCANNRPRQARNRDQSDIYSMYPKAIPITFSIYILLSLYKVGGVFDAFTSSLCLYSALPLNPSLSCCTTDISTDLMPIDPSRNDFWVSHSVVTAGDFWGDAGWLDLT